MGGQERGEELAGEERDQEVTHLSSPAIEKHYLCRQAVSSISGCFCTEMYVYVAKQTSPHLNFGSNVHGAALRPPPDVRPPLRRTCRAAGLPEHGAGRQLGVSVRRRVFGEAEGKSLRRAGLGFHRQDRGRENGDWRENEDQPLRWVRVLLIKCKN